MVRADYTIRLQQVFQGPMDLLLHLVREQEVEIHEVQIAQVIDGYFEYLKHLEDLDIEVAGEFLVMAATLMAIKSRSLLPREEVELEDELDPEDELIQRLVEYRRFKGAADDLGERYQEQSQRRPRGYRREVDDNEPERTFDLGELTPWDLLATFSRLMRETLANRPHQVRGNTRPLRWYVHELGRAMQARTRQTLRDFLTQLEDEPSKEGLIGAFCALLELVQMGLVSAVQESPDDEIEVVLANDPGDDFDRMIDASRLMDEEDAADDGLEHGDESSSEDEAEPEAGDAGEPGESGAVVAVATDEPVPEDSPAGSPGESPAEAVGESPGDAPVDVPGPDEVVVSEGAIVGTGAGPLGPRGAAEGEPRVETPEEARGEPSTLPEDRTFGATH